jgi:S1-C subfamily serine protease
MSATRRCLLLAVAVSALFVQPALSQERAVPPSAQALRMSYAPIVQRTAPAVVTVSAARVVANRNPLMDDPFFRRFFGPNFGGQQEQRQASLGSGALSSPIITSSRARARPKSRSATSASSRSRSS